MSSAVIDEEGLLRLEVPEKLEPVLTTDAPFVVVHGGRGSGKSWAVAKRLLWKGFERPRRIICAREVQKSLDDSVHQLLTDEIERMGLGWFYEVLATEIRGLNGTRFTYVGVKTDPNKIKGAENITDLWMEEAEAVSEKSWRIALPTIGRGCDDPQVFVVMNPYSEADASYIRWILNPPKTAVVIEANMDDNPWAPQYLKDQREESRQRDPAEYLHVWEGKTIEQAGTTEFDMTALQYWDADRLADINWYLLVDPSGSKKKEFGDWTVMAIVGIGKDRAHYIGGWVRDKFDLDEKWSAMVRLHERYRFQAIGYEDSAGGLEIDYFEREGSRTGYRLPILPLKNNKAKEERIRWLVPEVRARRLIMPKDCWYTQLDGTRLDLTVAFKKEMASFPHISAALHDDMLDATSRIMDPDLGAIPPSSFPDHVPRISPKQGRYDPATRRVV